jgi:ribonucleotide reductase alpha subunit
MTKIVIKNDGRQEPFDKEKYGRWVEWSDRSGVCFSTVSLETYKRLPEVVKSETIHQVMIDVCIEQEDISFSKMAARLEWAAIRKSMARQGFSDKVPFLDVLQWMTSHGVWDASSLPSYNPRWEDWYTEIKKTYLDCWQIQQWIDKYTLKYEEEVVETPHMGILATALAIHGDTQLALDYAIAVVQGEINMPTPVTNGCRNGDFDSISCCIASAEDSVGSIGVVQHISYEMTAKKAGIGNEFKTRSKGDPVKGGRVKHLGKEPIFTALEANVKMFTQFSRGGSATTTIRATDPDIERLILLKTQRVPLEERVDKIDYSLAYNDSFVASVIRDDDWHLFSTFHAHDLVEKDFYEMDVKEYDTEVARLIAQGTPHKTIKARDLLKTFLTARSETGRVYCINVTRVNKHTPFLDLVYLSNLCQEILLPTKPYPDMADLMSGVSQGETAFCTIAAINVGKAGMDPEHYAHLSRVVLETIDVLIDKAPMMTESMKVTIRKRRSVGVGITGLAGLMYEKGFDYDGSPESMEFVSQLSELHYYSLLEASQQMAETMEPVEGIDLNWLPIDTMIGSYVPKLDWERLRGIPRRHSVLVAMMPTESSAVFSGAENGLYPRRAKVIYKQSRKGLIQFISAADDVMTAWDVSNIDMAKYYGRVQNFCDQGISADYYLDYRKYPNGKVPMSILIKEWIVQAKAGVKTMYYVNSNDDNGGQLKVQAVTPDVGCDGGSCAL